ncbi:hypothetical protein BS50DRAFT_592489 [Corynespora cassiicola Philippines]|uniref:Glycosyltransferase family 25 protein n=1 Tax=Corynespora cassiicola Philippines TaxID=1448308 RepID=A0A2T2NA71_CORCC|nr:hypothetical protein BS50DRAFT_592489 [Corynespora cassiicola Philippines]
MNVKRTIQVLPACAIIVVLFFTFRHFHNGLHIPQVSPDHHVPYISRQPPNPRPANETLDFQEILYISMPYRTDRQDALSLLAAVTGLRLTMIPGVDVSTVHRKARPPGLSEDKQNDPLVGVWRAHANTWRYIIDNNISSALILEDDVDWDMNIKEIMGLWNWQLRYNNTVRWGTGNEGQGWAEECPYGCDWDELFMGQCGNTPNPDRLDLHQVYHDPHGPVISTTQNNILKEATEVWNLSSTDSSLRISSATYGPLCAMGYGLSRIGAMRMLYRIGGWYGFGMGVDNEIAFRTEDGYLSGYTMTPPAFTAWRTGDGKDSDNDAGMKAMDVKSEGNPAGWSHGLKKSARKSLGEVLDKQFWKDKKVERRR